VPQKGGCFAYGTTFLLQGEDGQPIERKLEDIQYGDRVLVHELGK